MNRTAKFMSFSILCMSATTLYACLTGIPANQASNPNEGHVAECTRNVNVSHYFTQTGCVMGNGSDGSGPNVSPTPGKCFSPTNSLKCLSGKQPYTLRGWYPNSTIYSTMNACLATRCNESSKTKSAWTAWNSGACGGG